MSFRSLDHVGIVVYSLERSIPWWTRFLDREPFQRRHWRPEERANFVGRIMGYEDCEVSGAFWQLPGGSVLELVEYHNPPPGRVSMETYNAGNTHLCLETTDIQADYERMAGLAEFRSPAPLRSEWGEHAGLLVCYLRDPDGISIELVEFTDRGRPFDTQSPFVVPPPRGDNRKG